MFRPLSCFLAAFSLSFPALANTSGTITNPVFSYGYGASPGTDKLDLSGNYAIGAGGMPFHLPSDAVTVSFSGVFSTTIPSGSFTCTSSACTYHSPSGGGVYTFILRTNGTFTLSLRSVDFSQLNPTQMGAVDFTVGTNEFAYIPNSVPVGAVTGPTSATVGTLVTFDATHSTDFNGDALTYSWTVVSQPLGSNITLSSTTNPTTSFTPAVNGSYVLRVTPSDATGAGEPTLATLTVTGGATPPPPAPGPSNGVVTLSTDLASYNVGDAATLTLHEDAQPGNGTSRWYFVATLNDAPIVLTPVPNSNNDSYVTPAFTSAGQQTFKVDVYIENTNLAKALAAQITSLNADITACNAALRYETNAGIIAQLQAQIASDLAQINVANDQLAQNRTKVGSAAVLAFSVN